MFESPMYTFLPKWGDEQTVERAQKMSEDPHRREQEFLNTRFVLRWTSFIKLSALHT